MSKSDYVWVMDKLTQDAFDQIFLKARSHNGWLDQDVDPELLQKVYDTMKFGPTSANSSPARLVFVQSGEAKEKLLACMDKGNIEKTKSAPVVAIIAHDMKFYDKLPELFPHADARAWFAGNEKLIETTAFRNGTLQGAYLMIAARMHGLDCGPMSGFDNAKVDATFFKGTPWRSNFLCALGHGDVKRLFPRSPRLDFNDACKIL